MFQVRLFGGASIDGERGMLTGRVRQRHRLALLALLAVSRDKPLSRDKVIAYLWPESDAERGRHLLSESLYVLRKGLGEESILSVSDDLRLNPEIVRTDVGEFEDALESGEVEGAVSLYAGPFLDGFFLTDAPEFERWVDGERERFRRRYQQALETLAEEAERRADFSTAADRWRRLATEDPYSSRIAVRLARALEACGERAEALRHIQSHTEFLRNDLDAEPGADLQELEDRLKKEPLTQPPPPRAAARPPLATAVAAGGERLPRWRFRRHRWSALAGAVVLTGSAVAVWSVARPRASSTVAVLPTRIAVFPFTVPPGADFADLGEGLMDLLSDALDGAGEIRRVDPNALMGRLRRGGAVGALDLETARRVARELEAGHFVLGRVVDLRGTVRISTALYSLSGSSEPQEDVEEGDLQNLRGLVDALARDILVSVPAIQGEFLGSVSSASTGSYPALRAYLRGQGFMRRHQTDSARLSFLAAVREDPAFALAWLRLAESQEWGGGLDFVASYEQAYRLRDHLSPRDRMFLETAYAFAHGEGAAAEKYALAMVTAYPDAVEGWRYLGDARRWYAWQLGRSVAEEAEIAYQRALALDPDNRVALNGLALVAYFDGRKARGDSLWERTFGRHWVPPEDSAGRARYFASLESREREVLANRVWGISLVTDSLTDAARIAALITDRARRPDSDPAVGHVLAAWVQLARGRWRAADVEFMRAALLEPGMGVLERAWVSAFPFFELDSASLRAIRDSLVRWTPPAKYRAQSRSYFAEGRFPRWQLPHAKHYVLGLLSARLGDLDAATRYAMQLERAREPADSIGLLHDLALEVRALGAAERGDWEASLKILEGAQLRVATEFDGFDSPYGRRPLGRFLRAEALVHAGRQQEALGWYGTLGWLFAESVLLAQVQVRTGEIYERIGDAAEAVRHYRRFLARWRDADPQYQPLLRDVEARVARLNTAKQKGG